MTNTPKIFISYARDDDARFVERLHNDLQQRGYDIASAQSLLEMDDADALAALRQIITGIDQLILVIGPNARTSPLVRAAWMYAWQECKGIIPILRLDTGLELPRSLQGVDFVDFRYNRRYEFARDELLSILEVPLAPVAELVGVPPLPEHYAPRDDALDAVKEALLRDSAPVSISAYRSSSAPDPGGYGKSMLAAAVARDCEIRAAFADGVYWVRLGTQPDIPLLQSQLLHQLTGKPQAITTAEEGKSWLQQILSNRDCLLILDEVHQAEHVLPFQTDSARSRLLITTNNAGLSDKLDTLDYHLRPLSEEQSARLLASTARQKLKSMPPITREFISLSEGRPLPLVMVGMALQGKPTAWGMTLQRIRVVDFGDKPFSAQQVSAEMLLKCLHVCLLMAASDLKLPEDNLADYYGRLAVFEAEQPIPCELVLKVLNAGQGGPDFTADILSDLMDRHLLLPADETGDHVMLHSLHQQYAALMSGDLRREHARLLAIYKTRLTGQGWPTGPDDGYYFQNIIQHFLMSDQDQAAALLLLDYNWQQAHLSRAGVHYLLRDFDRTLHKLKPDATTRQAHPLAEDLYLIREALALSASILAAHPDQLGPQLLGRLLDQDSPVIQKLLEQARQAQTAPWLRPLVPALKAPGSRGRSSLNVTSSVLAQPLAVTPDGQRVVLASRRHSLQVWNLGTGLKERALLGHSGAIRALAITPDGQTLISGGEDNLIKIWSLASGEEIRTLRGHTAPIWALTITPDGSRVISGAVDKTLRVWDIDLGVPQHTMTGHTAEITSLVALSDGKYMASASHDRTIKIWSLEDGTLVRTLRGHTHWIHALRATPDGKTLVSASRDKTIRLWDVTSGEEQVLLDGHNEAVTTLALSSDGQHVISASRDRTLKVWNIAQGKELRTLREASSAITAVEALPNGEHLLLTTPEAPFLVLDIKSAREKLSLGAHSSRINTLTVISHSDDIITGSWDGTVKVWHPQTGAVKHTFDDHGGAINTLSITHDGRYAVSGSWDNTLKVWNLDDGALTYTLKGHIEGITASAITPDHRYLVAASSDNLITVWDLTTGTRLHTLREHEQPVTDLALTPDSQCAISAALDGKLILWDIINGELRHCLEGHTEGVTAVQILPSGQQAVSGGRDGKIIRWNLVNGEAEQALDGHSGWINTLRLTNDASHLVSGADDGLIKIWPLAASTPKPAPMRPVAAAEQASASQTTSGQVEPEKEETPDKAPASDQAAPQPRTLHGHTHWVWDVALTPDDRLLYSVSSDGTLRAWDVESGRCLAAYTADSPLMRCALTRKSGIIAAGAQSGQLHLLKLEEK